MEDEKEREETKEHTETTETKHESHETKSDTAEHKTEHAEHHTDPKPAIKPVKSKSGKKIIATIITIVVIVALVLILWKIGLFAKTTVTETEMLNLTYDIKAENETIDSGTNSFAAGSIASTLGFQTDKLDTEITAMQKGETKDITLEAADAYGEYDEKLVFTFNRTEKMPRSNEVDRIMEITKEEFVGAFDEQPEVDKEYTLTNAPWPIKVLEKNDTHVKISQEAEVGDEIPNQPFISKVTKVTDEKITLTLQGNDTIMPTPSGNIEIKFTEDKIISTLTPEIGQWIELPYMPKAKVTGMNDTHIFLDANHEFAGKTLIVSITLNSRSIEKSTVTGGTVIAGAPTMQVFIMSYCPYGLQFLKAMIPVMEKLQDKANIELRFVGYTMHGDKEEEENNRMICLREEQYSKLIPYLKCFTQSGDSASCIAQAGIDKAKLETCMASKVEQYYAEDKALNEKYGVKGSPTVVIDGQEAQIERNPEAIKTALCEAFTTQPSECSETLSTETPSPGFGSGTSSSGGSCG